MAKDLAMRTVTHREWVLELLEKRVVKMVKHLTTAAFVIVVTKICPEGSEWFLWDRHGLFWQYVWRCFSLPDSCESNHE